MQMLQLPLATCVSRGLPIAFLWSIFYTALTRVLLTIALACLPLLRRYRPKPAKWIAMRYWPRRLRFQPELWVHAVSVGEIQIATALLSVIGHEKVLLTTTTQAGYKILRKRYGAGHVRYLPWDLTRCYARLFNGFKVPHLLVVETEIWPNLFRFLSNANASLVIVNGRVSDKTLRLRNNALFRATLGRVTRILARGEEDRKRFLAFGLSEEKVAVVGNIKFDARPGTLDDPLLRQWLANAGCLILFASISSDEAPLLAPACLELLAQRPRLRVLWVPRHLEYLDEHLSALAPAGPVCRSKLDAMTETRLLVLDTFGELSGSYAYAQLSLVGGSFNQRGGQNFLESLQAGTPVLVGPSTENFAEETAEADAAGALRRLTGTEEVAAVFHQLLDDEAQLKHMADRAAWFLGRHGGAIERTHRELIHLGLVPKPSDERSLT